MNPETETQDVVEAINKFHEQLIEKGISHSFSINLESPDDPFGQYTWIYSKQVKLNPPAGLIAPRGNITEDAYAFADLVLEQLKKSGLVFPDGKGQDTTDADVDPQDPEDGQVNPEAPQPTDQAIVEEASHLSKEEINAIANDEPLPKTGIEVESNPPEKNYWQGQNQEQE